MTRADFLGYKKEEKSFRNCRLKLYLFKFFIYSCRKLFVNPSLHIDQILSVSFTSGCCLGHTAYSDVCMYASKCISLQQQPIYK